MSRSITQAQVLDLERHHGAGMVVVLSVGDTDFAFRRMSESDVDLCLHQIENKLYGALEEAAVRCILSVDAPAANPRIEATKGSSKAPPVIVAPEIVAERALLTSMWAQGQLVRDTVGQGFGRQCGWHWYLNSEPIGGGRYSVTATTSPPDEMSEDDEKVELTASILTSRQYEEQRKRMVTEPDGNYQRYNFRSSIQDAGDVARLYPFLVVAIGGLIPSLGAEGKAVRRKKFVSSSPTPHGTTGATQAAETSA